MHMNMHVHIHTGRGSELWSRARLQMMQISQYVMHCVQELLDNKQGCFEWFGLDFMLDDEFNAWICELACARACGYGYGCVLVDALTST
jgi:hypothetical protein